MLNIEYCILESALNQDRLKDCAMHLQFIICIYIPYSCFVVFIF